MSKQRMNECFCHTTQLDRTFFFESSSVGGGILFFKENCRKIFYCSVLYTIRQGPDEPHEKFLFSIIPLNIISIGKLQNKGAFKIFFQLINIYRKTIIIIVTVIVSSCTTLLLCGMKMVMAQQNKLINQNIYGSNEFPYDNFALVYYFHMAKFPYCRILRSVRDKKKMISCVVILCMECSFEIIMRVEAFYNEKLSVWHTKTKWKWNMWSV